MIFTPTDISGVVVVDLERREDARGFFARAYCRDEFARAGLCTEYVQANVSYNVTKGTLRGLHWQEPPDAEVKLVRCTRGAVHDVVVDVRPGSPTHARWFGVRLDAESGRAIHVPEGCAHGYLTLTDGAEVHYLVSSAYAPAAERGARWDDPAFGIEWPDVGRVTVSERDRAHAPYQPAPGAEPGPGPS